MQPGCTLKPVRLFSQWINKFKLWVRALTILAYLVNCSLGFSAEPTTVDQAYCSL